MPMTEPPVGWPTSLPRPSVRKAWGRSRRRCNERLLMSTMSGLVHLRSSERSTRPCAAVAVLEERVFLAAEVVQHLVVRVAAAVVAHVEDDRFLVEVVGVQGADEAVEAGLVHAGDVDVAELALAQLGDACRRCVAPSARTSGRVIVGRDGRGMLDACGASLAGRRGCWSLAARPISPALPLRSCAGSTLSVELVAVDARMSRRPSGRGRACRPGRA